jgi:uncharacterized lipoprotein YmbA
MSIDCGLFSSFFMQWSRILVCLSAGSLLLGCAGSGLERAYGFSSVREQPAQRLGQMVGLVVVGPVRLNREIDRQQLVVQVTADQAEIRETDQWLGTLDDEIKRLYVERLGQHVQGAKVVAFPWLGTEAVRYRIGLEVLDMKVMPGAQARLRLRWSLYDEQTEKELQQPATEYSAKLSAKADLTEIVRIYQELHSRAALDMAKGLLALVG